MTQLTKVLIILAFTSATLGAPVNKPRQLAGEGDFFDSVFSGTDNGVGYGVENAEDHVAELLGGTPSQGGGTGGGAGGPPPPPPPKKMVKKMVKRQADKIANGAAGDLDTLHLTGPAGIVQNDGDAVDGQLTGDAATLGAQIGGDEEDFLERAGDLVPNQMPAASGT
ncbi:hypothetical protein F53441_3354 [Fusarium austroafricanum]|uniref:Uncharacterized protein n=1 Tax=Fusarium austroafricanum TaxID=2364996 RepID=A0A8H4KQV8_9HYPO|nr:hypothetical protein F53441_3354 [Fusarium austroafricanum]